MAGEQWYYVQAGQRFGPVPIETLRGLLAANAVNGTDLVWSEGMPDWLAAAAIPALGTGQPQVAPPPSGYAPPGYTPPGYAPPGYAQPGYAPPGYAPPGYVPPGYAPAGANLGYYTPQQSGPFYAGFWLRFVAAVIDGLLLFVLTFLVSFVIGLVVSVGGTGGLANSRRQAQILVIVVAQLVSTGIQWIYFAGMESSANQGTLGKMALGLKVTDLNLQRVGFGKATGRFFGKLAELAPSMLGNLLVTTHESDADTAVALSSIGGLLMIVTFGMAGWSARKQAVHDMMAGCLVVKK